VQCHGSQGQTERAVALQEEEEEGALSQTLVKNESELTEQTLFNNSYKF
jgi:hypothetical protein